MTSETQKHQARFWRKYLRLTRGHVAALQALEIIIQEEKDPAFSKTIAEILTTLKAGKSFNEAFSQHPGLFSLSVLELLKAAESSGAWDDILEEIAAGLEEGTFD